MPTGTKPPASPAALMVSEQHFLDLVRAAGFEAVSPEKWYLLHEFVHLSTGELRHGIFVGEDLDKALSRMMTAIGIPGA